MEGLFWFRCNKCFVKPGKENNYNFFLTSCLHIFCKNCVKPGQPLCSKCKGGCQLMEINKEMPQEMKKLFSDVTNNDTVMSFMKAAEFQSYHRSHLITHLKEVKKKYDNVKAHVKKMEGVMNQLQQKYTAAKGVIKDQHNQLQVLKREYQKQIQTIKEMKQRSTFDPDRMSKFTFGENPPSSTYSSFATPATSFGIYRNAPPSGSVMTSGSIRSRNTHSSKASTPHSSVISTLINERQSSRQEATPPSKTLELLSLLNKNRR